MPTELRDIRVTFLSLVPKGANKKKVIWKSAEGEEGEPLEAGLKSLRKSEERRMVYGVVYAPEQVDTQGDFAKADEIAKAAHGFMKEALTGNVDVKHDFDPRDAYVAESWITKGVDSLFDREPAGSWAVGIKVESDELWEQVKKGELAGISMAGRAVKVKKEDDGGDILAKLEELLTKFFKGAGDAKGVKKASDADDAKKDDITPEDIAELAKQLEGVGELKKENEALKKRVEELEKSTQGRQSRAADKGAAAAEDYSDLV